MDELGEQRDPVQQLAYEELMLELLKAMHLQQQVRELAEPRAIKSKPANPPGTISLRLESMMDRWKTRRVSEATAAAAAAAAAAAV